MANIGLCRRRRSAVAAVGLIVPLLVCGIGRSDDARPGSRLLTFHDVNGVDRPVRSPADWRTHRCEILSAMQDVMGPLPDVQKKVPLDVRTIEEVIGEKTIRRKLTIATEVGDRLPAYLFIPKSADRPTAGRPLPASDKSSARQRRGRRVRRQAGRALRRRIGGARYVTLAPDYVNMGEYHFDPYAHGYVSATMKGIWNHMRCIDLLQSLPEVDGEKIGGNRPFARRAQQHVPGCL